MRFLYIISKFTQTFLFNEYFWDFCKSKLWLIPFLYDFSSCRTYVFIQIIFLTSRNKLYDEINKRYLIFHTCSWDNGISMSTYKMSVEVDVTCSLNDLVISRLSWNVSVVTSWSLKSFVVTAKVLEYLNLHIFVVEAVTSTGSSSSPIIKFMSVDFPELVSPSKSN